MWSTSDPVSSLGLFIAVILVAAKLGGDIASRLKQPPVLGELVVGTLLGSLPLAFLERLRTDASVDMLGRVGALVLLFEVGLDSTVKDVMRVGVASTRVAILGTGFTLLVGWIAARLVMPASGTLVHLFVAAAIAATSIGVSARVLKDAGASRSREAHVILGAAVIDDVLGLVVLAIVSAAVAQVGTGTMTPLNVGLLVGRILVFLVVAALVGTKVSPILFRASAHLRTDGALLAAGLSFCFVVAWASDLAGLAPIVGAFAAGLILEESHSREFVERGERSLRERMEPISSWLVPIFFVLVGMRADFGALRHPATWCLVIALVLAAVLGKLACAVGAPAGTDRIAIAFAMIPRGEVSLVFASLGLSLHLGGRPLLDGQQYSALVTVVVVTTLVTPLALRWRLGSRGLPDALGMRRER
jgi:Kef-type K+ transport system membrane component KefB